MFADWEGVAALIVLHEFSTPVQVMQKGVGGIVERWKQDKICAVGIKRAERLIEEAKTSTGIEKADSCRYLVKDYS